MRIEVIEDARDPRLNDYRALRDTTRRDPGLFVVESWLVVGRLLAGARFRVRSILASPMVEQRLGDALASAPDDLVVYVASHPVIREVLGFTYHRGCVAVAEREPTPPADALLAPAGPRRLLVLEHVSDPDNVGALFRNAQAFGVDGVLLAAGTSDPLYAKTVRVSMGAVLALPFARLDRWPEGLGAVKAAGFTVAALTPRGAVELGEVGTAWPVPERLAMLVGSEGDGLSEAARAQADVTLRIGMAHDVDSLNVAVAAAIALHGLGRGRGR